MVDKAKNPSTILYWNDIDQDPAVNACSIAAQGLWWKMLACAARSPEPGVVLLGNHPSPRTDLPRLFAKIIGETVEATAVLLDELITMGAASVDDKDRVYNRRMVREEAARKAVSEARSKAGKSGAEAKKARKQTVSKSLANDAANTLANGQQTEPALSDGDHSEIPVSDDDPSQQNGSKPVNKSQPSSFLPFFSSSKTIDVTTEDLSLSDEPISDRAAEEGADAPASERLDPGPIPDFLKASTARAAEIASDWLPSVEIQASLEKSRPDLTPEIVQRRMGEFRAWCAEKRTMTHNPDATWFGFMLKTKDHSHGSQRGNGSSQVDSGPTELDGVAAAVARRYVQSG